MVPKKDDVFVLIGISQRKQEAQICQNGVFCFQSSSLKKLGQLETKLCRNVH